MLHDDLDLSRASAIGPHEQHAAVIEPEMSNRDRHRRAVDQHFILAPVELVGLRRGKAQRHEGCSR